MRPGNRQRLDQKAFRLAHQRKGIAAEPPVVAWFAGMGVNGPSNGIPGVLGVNGRTIGCVIHTDALQITPEILRLIAAIDEFKGA